MKNKLRILIMAVCIMAIFGTVGVCAAEAPAVDDISISSLSASRDKITATGTTADSVVAVVAQIRSAEYDEIIYAITSAGVDEDNSFTVEFSGLALPPYDTFNLYIANYEGGNWQTETFTLSESEPVNDPSGGNTDPSGGNTDPSGGNTDPSGGNTDPSGGNTDPSGGNTYPSGGNTDPSGSNTDPSGGNTNPSGGNTDTSENNTDSSEGTESSEDNSGTSEDGTSTDGQADDNTAGESDNAGAEPEIEYTKDINDVISEFTENDKDSDTAKLLSQLAGENADTETSADSISIEVSKDSTNDADKGKLDGGVFKNADGEIITNSFVESTGNGKMYFADSEGKKVTNSIVTDGEKLYYCSRYGAVATDKAVNIGNGITVLTDSTGAIITKSNARVTVGGKSYITGEGGTVQKKSVVTISVNTRKDGKKTVVERTYITNGKGVIKTGLVKHGKRQYVTSKTGIVRKNKLTRIDGKLIYTNGKGYVVKNKKFTYNGKTYKSDGNGYAKLVK